jgi:hypothetical protein
MAGPCGRRWPAPAATTHGGTFPPTTTILATEGICAFGDGRLVEYRDNDVVHWSTRDIGPQAPDGQPLVWDRPMSQPQATAILGQPWPRWRDRRATRPVQIYLALRTGGAPAGVAGALRYAMTRRRRLAHQAVLLDEFDLTAPLPPPRWLTGTGAAQRAGTPQNTWPSYVAREQAPAADTTDEASGTGRWWDGTVDAWSQTRPGQGARADLEPDG